MDIELFIFVDVVSYAVEEDTSQEVLRCEGV